MFIESMGSIGDADEKVIPQGKQREALNAYLSESPFEDFVSLQLSQELLETQKYDSKKRLMKLSELPGYEDNQATATRLTQEFQSLPWEYVLSFPLPLQIGGTIRKAMENHPISDGIKFVVPDETFSTEYSLTSGIEARDSKLTRDIGIPDDSTGGTSALSLALATVGQAFMKPKWNSEIPYLQIHVKGFIGCYGLTAPMEDGIDYLKALLGLAVAGPACIYVLHDLAQLDLDPAAAQFDVVVSGHSHKAGQFEKDGVLYVNPGSAGPRRFRLPITVAHLDLRSHPWKVEFVELPEDHSRT